jgi:tripartite-type tricarboxylate transporter receptor subunit TctC
MHACPTRPVHVVVGFSAGGGVDTIARLMAQSAAFCGFWAPLTYQISI